MEIKMKKLVLILLTLGFASQIVELQGMENDGNNVLNLSEFSNQTAVEDDFGKFLEDLTLFKSEQKLNQSGSKQESKIICDSADLPDGLTCSLPKEDELILNTLPGEILLSSNTAGLPTAQKTIKKRKSIEQEEEKNNSVITKKRKTSKKHLGQINSISSPQIIFIKEPVSGEFSKNVPNDSVTTYQKRRLLIFGQIAKKLNGWLLTSDNSYENLKLIVEELPGSKRKLPVIWDALSKRDAITNMSLLEAAVYQNKCSKLKEILRVVVVRIRKLSTERYKLNYYHLINKALKKLISSVQNTECIELVRDIQSKLSKVLKEPEMTLNNQLDEIGRNIFPMLGLQAPLQMFPISMQNQLQQSLTTNTPDATTNS